MINVSRRSRFAQREKSLSHDKMWYDNAIEIATQDRDNLNEEDLYIAVEASIHAIELKKELVENGKRTKADRPADGEIDKVQKKSKGLWRWIRNHNLMSTFYGGKQMEHEEAKIDKGPSRENGVDGGMDGDVNENRSDAILCEEKEEREGLFGTSIGGSEGPLYRFLSSESTSTKKKFVALISWGLACIGLLIALIFLTRDFVSSQRGAARTIQYVPSSTLDIPKLWFCTADTGLPTYTEITLPYKGNPLVWIDFLKGSSANLNLIHPETMKLPQFTQEAISVQGRACNASTKMDPKKYYEENSQKPFCFHCMTLDRNPALSLNKDSDKGALSSSSRLSVRLSKQAFLSRCRTSQSGFPRGLLQFFRAEMKENSQALEQSQILNFSGVNAIDSSNDGILWPLYRHGLMNITVDYYVYDVIDMFCNVYMFSGFFYPTTAEDIRFRFNRVIHRWERSGKGPYYPPSYSDYYKPIHLDSDDGTSGIIGSEKFENRSVFSGTTMYVMTNASKVGTAETLVVLEPADMAEVSFERHHINGKESVTASVLRSSVEPGDIRGINFVYFVEFSFSSFLTRQVTDQQAMAWTAFLADFFGLTSLFLDLSVYTIIVSPILGHRKIKRKRTNSERGERLSRRGYTIPGKEQE